MKKYLSVLIFLLLFLNISAQKQSNFAPIGAMWNYSYDGNVFSGHSVNRGKVIMEAVKDTIINETSTSKIEITQFDPYHPTADSYDVEYRKYILPSYYVYSNNDTVYMYDEVKNEFGVIFVFNVSVGDTFYVDITQDARLDKATPFIVDSVVVLNNGQKKYRGSLYNDIYNGQLLPSLENWYMDEIGGLNSFLLKTAESTSTSTAFDVYCNDTFVYPEGITCNETAGFEKFIEKQDEILIYPLPVIDILNIETKETINKVNIYDVYGVLKEQSDNKELNFSSYSSGVYFIKIIKNNGTEIIKKVVK